MRQGLSFVFNEETPEGWGAGRDGGRESEPAWCIWIPGPREKFVVGSFERGDAGAECTVEDGQRSELRGLGQIFGAVAVEE